jgi:hypothetical protein
VCVSFCVCPSSIFAKTPSSTVIITSLPLFSQYYLEAIYEYQRLQATNPGQGKNYSGRSVCEDLRARHCNKVSATTLHRTPWHALKLTWGFNRAMFILLLIQRYDEPLWESVRKAPGRNIVCTWYTSNHRGLEGRLSAARMRHHIYPLLQRCQQVSACGSLSTTNTVVYLSTHGIPISAETATQAFLCSVLGVCVPSV